MVTMINVADLKDPDDQQGRSYRQVNAEKTHAVPIGTLVELETGVRLFVVLHTRDCDQTPLYSLGVAESDNTWLDHGYDENSITVVTPNVELTGSAQLNTLTKE